MKKEKKGAGFVKPEGLDNKEKGVLVRLGKRHAFKLMNQLRKAYNKLCPGCKLLVMRDSRRPLKDYCVTCRKVLKDIIGGYQ